ncbi:DNA-binding domain-containing protein [Catalinimonas niigatensis]|uniref:DNA-binding domain-containing protein n=1 Tax=Catalinimonas niigatensis TaxID=1397264 RepID=UPI002664F9FC|nr:DNA-binding domain-containing protein [Catalinimonas niigatensis]WPP53443.1 DNA-binding domain-containing protein [Catalinimonas niigatensis]
MYLFYSLQDNPLTPDPTDFRAQVQNNPRLTVEEVVEKMTVEGSILKKTECNAVIKAFLQEVTHNISQGIGFTSDYFTLYHTINGVFANAKDEFDPERHQINIKLLKNTEMRRAVDRIITKKLQNVVPTPELIEFYDYASDSTNQQITPGNTAELSGELIKVENPEAAEQGVFFMHSSGTEYRVARLRNNTRGKLSFVIPTGMKKGAYSLEVRTTISGSKEVRKGTINGLQVV